MFPNSFQDSNCTTSQWKSYNNFFTIADVFWTYIIPIFISVGIPGNLFCLYALKKKLQETSAYYFIFFMVINDTFLLTLSVLSYSFHWFPYPWKSYTWTWLWIYVFYTLQLIPFYTSPYLILCAAIDRTLSVCAPFYYYRRLNVKKFAYLTVIAVIAYQTFYSLTNQITLNDIFFRVIALCENSTEDYCLYHTAYPPPNIFYSYVEPIYILINVVLQVVILFLIITLNSVFIYKCNQMKKFHATCSGRNIIISSPNKNDAILASSLFIQSFMTFILQSTYLSQIIMVSPMTNESTCNQSLFYLFSVFMCNFFQFFMPSANLFIYCLMIKGFRLHVFCLCKDTFIAFKKKIIIVKEKMVVFCK